MADYVRGMHMNLWLDMRRKASRDVYAVLRKQLRHSAAARALVNRLMERYVLNVDEALELLMALYCLLEDNMLYLNQGMGNEAGMQS